jgi:hypothetical protein
MGEGNAVEILIAVIVLALVAATYLLYRMAVALQLKP